MKTMRSIYHRALGIGLIFSALMLGAPEGARCAEFNCSSGDVACLIGSINTANSNGVADTIILRAGTYSLTAPDMTAPPQDTK